MSHDKIASLIILYFFAVNLTGFLMMGIDKRKAVRGRWRISEFHLFIPAFLGGGAGCLIGMYFFHHKTHKPRFCIGMPAVTLCWLILLVFLLT